MKNGLIIGGAIFLGLIGLGAMSSSEPEAEAVKVPTPTVSVERVSDGDWGGFRTAFVTACAAEPDGNPSYCGCTIDYLESKHGRHKVVEMATQYAESNILPEGFYEAVGACIDEY